MQFPLPITRIPKNKKMYLKQVTINGFKSFADKTELPLTPGITCIVGPNGCGKSNIVDAIRWVLGEQSAKALRGGKMQDVIFQGTETRKPLQFCDVSLLFTDCEKQLKFNEVEITRKVYRDGGSDYFINGKSARLKDIQNLFMDTGVGRVSYSFMVQGQIDQILSSNPGERRTIFEEAAGITKYKTQRREALNKLALVEQNLARATDRIEEISRQIGTLKRQASKALRYKRLSYRLRHLDLALNSHNYAKQNALLKEDETVQKRLSSEILELSEKLAACEEDLSRMRASRAELLAQLESLRQNASEVRSAKEQAERNSEFAEVRKRDLGERLEQISKELESLKEQLSALEGKAQGDIEVKQMQLNLVSADDEVFRQQSAELAEVEESLRDAENRLSRAKQDSLMNESAVTRLRSNCTTLEVDLKSYQVRHAALSDQIFQLKEENSSLERRCEELSAAMENANERLGNAEADITEAVAKADELRAQYRNQQAEIQQMDRQLASKSAKLSLLNDLQSRMEGFSEGVKAIMKGRLGECLDPLNLKIVSQNVEVADGWTSAFETMLGSAVDAVAIEDSSKLPQALALLRERNLGNACFQIKDANLNAISDADALPQGIWRGCDIVKPQDPDLSEYVRNMVAGCYFCEDIMQFANFALNNKNFKFMAAVAKDGSMLDARGIIYASSGEKRDTQSSFILRNSEIKRIKEEIEVDNDALTTLNERAMQIQSQLESAEAEIENRKNLSSEIKREIASINAQSSSAKAAFSEKNSEIEKKTAAMAEMENSRFEAQDRLNSAMKALEDAEKSISESRNLISETEAQIAELRETKDQKYAVLSETRLELAAIKSRLESLERGLGAIREQQAETRALIERRTIESQSIARQIENFDAETLSERERAKNLAENLEAALGEIEAQRVKVAESETSIAEYENSLSAEREAHMRKTSEKNECQIRIAKIRSKLDFISERILSEYDVEIANVDWKSELWKSDEEFEIKVKLDELEDGEINAKPKRERGDPTQDDLDAMESTDFSPIEDEVRELRERINAMGR